VKRVLICSSQIWEKMKHINLVWYQLAKQQEKKMLKPFFSFSSHQVDLDVVYVNNYNCVSVEDYTTTSNKQVFNLFSRSSRYITSPILHLNEAQLSSPIKDDDAACWIYIAMDDPPVLVFSLNFPKNSLPLWGSWAWKKRIIWKNFPLASFRWIPRISFFEVPSNNFKLFQHPKGTTKISNTL